MRDMLLIETCSKFVCRPVPPPALLARSKPPIVTGTLAVGTPLIDTSRASPAL
jgi:hypothetical protein